MVDILYKLTDKVASCLIVTGLNDVVPGVKKEFQVENGIWSGYYQDGEITYPVGDWRHGTSNQMELYTNFTFVTGVDVQAFPSGYYNYIIYRFEKDILGLHKG